MTARPSDEKQLRPFEIAIVGNDLLLEALPGRPLQVAHAIHACGYDLVVPVSWGEELVAMHVLDALETAGQRPLIFSACPKVRSRLMASGPELLPHLVPCIAPPAAAARYLRALEPDVRMRVTYIGACPGAADTSIDVRITPSDFLAHLERRSIAILEQPLVYESVIPPDRRRHASLPGGMPAPDGVSQRGFQFAVLREGDEISAEIAQHIIAADRVLMDMAPSVGCNCAGFVTGGSREAVIALEPPRSTLPVLDREVHVALDLPMPASEPHGQSSPRGTADEPRDVAPAADVGATVAGVHSIEAAARRRAERLRIAVTPPGVRTTQGTRPAEAQSATTGQGREAPALPVTGTEPARTAPLAAPIEAEHPTPASPEREVTGSAGEPSPMPMPSEDHVVAPGETESAAAAAEPRAPEPEPTATEPEPAAPSSEPALVRRRTPAYGFWHSSRTTARQRMVATEGTSVPRAYNAVRRRSGSFVAVEPAVTPSRTGGQPEPEMVTPVVTGPLAQAPATPDVLAPGDLESQPRRSRRHDPRRVDGAGTSRARRLWNLLMAIILIAALIVTLFVISRG